VGGLVGVMDSSLTQMDVVSFVRWRKAFPPNRCRRPNVTLIDFRLSLDAAAADDPPCAIFTEIRSSHQQEQ